MVGCRKTRRCYFVSGSGNLYISVNRTTVGCRKTRRCYFVSSSGNLYISVTPYTNWKFSCYPMMVSVSIFGYRLYVRPCMIRGWCYPDVIRTLVNIVNTGSGINTVGVFPYFHLRAWWQSIWWQSILMTVDFGNTFPNRNHLHKKEKIK